MILCVYALTGPQPLLPVARGLARERLRLVKAGAVGAVVGEVARRPRPTLANLRRYDAVIRRLGEARTAILPARFGTCFSSLDELTFVLRSRQSSLRASLAEVRHRAQMTVRVLSDPGSGIRDPGSGRLESGIGLTPGFPAGRRVPSSESGVPDRGSRYLRARAEEAAREREIPGFGPVRGAVRRWVRGERVERRAGIASVYHLVPRASAAAYRRAVERAVPSTGLRVVVTGPWPPYAFATW